MPEGIALAEKLAIDLSEEDIEDLLTVLATLPPAGKTSMLQSRGERKTEVEIFAGRLVSMGEQYGIANPVNRAILHIVKVMEQRSAGLNRKNKGAGMVG